LLHEAKALLSGLSYFAIQSSPDFLKLSPSPNTVQNLLKCKVHNVWEMQPFHNENAAFLFH